MVYTNRDNELTVSADARWGSTEDAKSFEGYTIKIGDNLVSWKSRKQGLVALSTCEAELISLCEAVQGLLSGLGVDVGTKLPICVKTDSKAAIDWISNLKVTNRTKHINRKYYFIKDEANNDSIKLKHVKSECMEADLLKSH